MCSILKLQMILEGSLFGRGRDLEKDYKNLRLVSSLLGVVCTEIESICTSNSYQSLVYTGHFTTKH